MRQNAFYSNKCHARRGMTILIDAMVSFETVDRSVDGGSFGEWQLGLKFNDSTIYPVDQSDLEEIKALVRP